MLSTAAKVRTLIRATGENVAFTTGQLLSCGNRNAIDIELCRLVKKGTIKRLAAGVFIIASAILEIPSAFELALLKAKRFGKRAMACPDAESTSTRFYRTDGCKSSFESVRGRIHFKHSAPSKFDNASATSPIEAQSKPVESKRSPAEIDDDPRIQYDSGQVTQLAIRLIRLLFSLLDNHQARKVSVSLVEQCLVT